MRTASRFVKVLVLVVLLGVIAMMASGCGSRASAQSGAGGVTVVRIGVGVPLTAGPVAFGQGIKRATELAVKQANASERAKKLNVKFEAVAGDDQGDPKVGVTVANTFASDPQLVGVVGHVNSGVSIPASKVYSQKKTVEVTPISTNPALTEQGLNNIFRVCTIDTVQGSFAADSAFKDLGRTKAYVVDDSTPYGEGLAQVFADQFKADGGSVVGQEKTSDKDTDFTALATKIKNSGADVVYYGGVYNAGALLSKQVKEQGSTAPLLGGDGLYDGQYIKLAGQANAQGDYSTAIGLPLDRLPRGAQFKAQYAAAYPNDELAAYDPYGYDSANVIIDAVLTAAEKVGAQRVTSPQGRDAIIAAAHATNSEGVTGKLQFDAKGDTLNRAVTLYTVKGDAWVPWAK